MTPKKQIAFLAILTALGVLVTACRGVWPGSETSTVEPVQRIDALEVEPITTSGVERVTLRTHISSEPPTLDPALVRDTISNFFVGQMFVGLTRFDQDSNAIPELARDWEVSKDGLVWTFRLRGDISWVRRDPTTGNIKVLRPVDAHDVVYGLRRSLDPNTASGYAYVLYPIAGAEALNRAAPDAENLEALVADLGVKAIDDTTVEFSLIAPVVYFPSIVALAIAYPQPRDVIEQWGHNWTEAGLIVTNGPYTLQEWTHGASLMLEKNPWWVNADEVQIELFGGPILPEESEAMALYESNELDMMASPGWGPPPQDLDRIRADAQLSQELFIAPRTCTYYYGFVNTKPPFDEARVRKAFAIAIDRESIVSRVFKGGQAPAHSFVPPGVFGNVAEDHQIGALLLGDYAGRLAQARALLVEAGYPDGAGIDIVLGYNSSEGHAQIAQAVRAMWQRAFPQAQISLESQEWAAYLDILEPDSPDEDKPHVYRAGWCADYPDSNNWLNDVFNSKSSSNSAKFDNPDYDAIVEKAAFEADPERRLELYRQAEAILIDQEAVIAPIFYYTYVRLYKPWVTPVISPVGADPIAEWRIDVAAQRAATGQ
jgi:oligopeptide transport system substrate-binding protein